MADVSIMQGNPVTDLSTPPGFSPIIIWAYNDLFTLPTNPSVETLSFQCGLPVQTSAKQWQTVFDSMRTTLLSQGYSILAYGVWEQPTQQIVVPDTICFLGTSTCLTIPAQICFPVVGCINLAGTTLLSGYTYQIWVLVEVIGGAAPLVLNGHGYQARGQIQFAIAFFLIMFSLVAGLVFLKGIATGQLTVDSIRNLINDWLTTPARNLVPVEGAIVWPLALMGAALAIAGVAVPALAFSGSIQLPGGVGGSTGLGIGQGAPSPYAPPAESTTSRRRGR